MISSLDEAWRWYECVRTLAECMDRLGAKSWDREEWVEPLSRDNRFRLVEATALRDQAETITGDLDDVGVFVIFSAFEAKMNDIRYEIILYWSKEDEAFIAEVPELPGCAADGASYQEAVANVEVVIQEWIETARDMGRPIPEPRGRLMYA
jgi:predicted RNase H-like HicB family nuclease